ncbi:MAG TPA: YdcF family protein [Segeticoccus sp.]|uniref:YdcF family protein n=1 Tax=Segeticoccus sp. TaxID=2706531 RepID=UPI002D807E6F|nr:YdcF family protein [Segeticoccus sp.]HET8602070.1 YdcF family protein [Segeticoccus sp.]
MVGDVARVVLAVAAPLLLAPLVGCLLLDGLAGPHRRRHGRALSLAGAVLAAVVLVLDDLALLHSSTGIASGAAVVAVLACWVGVVFLAVLLHPLVCRLRSRAVVPEVVVVLGSKLTREGQVPPVLACRLDRAAALWRGACDEGREVTVVVSGSAVAGRPVSEAAAMATYLVAHGLPAGCLLLEGRATTTDENLLLSSRLVVARSGGRRASEQRGPDRGGRGVGRRGDGAPPRLAVVTSTFHTFRTARAAARLHVPARVWAAPTPWSLVPAASLRELGILLRERLPVQLAGCATLALAAVLTITWG